MDLNTRKHRVAAAALAVALVFIWGRANASWARFSNSELIATSRLIVTGTLAKFTTIKVTTGGPARTVGVIDVDDVLKGDPGTRTVRIYVPQPGAPISSSDIRYKIGQTGLWFLRLLSSPNAVMIYAADQPQRFVPSSGAGPIIGAVRKYLKGAPKKNLP